MIRSDIIEQFREECSEITSRVIADSVLNSWLKLGDHQFCAETRCIVDQDGTSWDTAVNDEYYDLTAKITNFYDIDEYPGSGVLYNGKRIGKTTMAQLDTESPSWRSRSVGTPRKWYRRGKYLYVDRPIDTAGTDYMKVYSVLLSTDWDADVAPYNQLTYLEPFHEAMVLFLIKKAKAKIGKEEEALKAQAEYTAFVGWSKRQLGGNKFSPIYFRKAT